VVQISLGTKARFYLKNNQNKKAGGVVQVVEHLPLYSIHCTVKKKKKEKKKEMTQSGRQQGAV
jgi:hypothetical protein